MKCYCTATRVSDGKNIKGSTVSIAMAKAEGWTRNTKWKTMPEQMLKYRAATFFGRQYIPDLLLGVQTSEEVVDITPLDVSPVEINPSLKRSKAAAEGAKNITEKQDDFDF